MGSLLSFTYFACTNIGSFESRARIIKTAKGEEAVVVIFGHGGIVRGREF